LKTQLAFAVKLLSTHQCQGFMGRNPTSQEWEGFASCVCY